MRSHATSPSDWLSRAARAWPSHTALIAMDRVYSFGDLPDYLEDLSIRQALHGARRLTVLSGSNQDLAVGAYLALQLDATFCPRPTEYPGEVSGETGAGLRTAIGFPASRTSIKVQRSARRMGAMHRLIVGTSGTTGLATDVALSDHNLAASVAASRSRVPLAPGDMWLACLPMHHISGLMMLYRCLEAGASLLVRERFSAEDAWNCLRDFGVTHFSAVPAMLSRLLAFSNQAPPPSLKAVLVGGGPLSSDLAQRAVDTGWPLYATYGMTETCSQVATGAIPPSGWNPGDIGPPLPGITIRIVDARLQPTTGLGRIEIQGPVVASGSEVDADRTGRVSVDHRLLTADLGSIDDRGHLHVLGRADDVIITGGVNVHPEYVERKLGKRPGVRDVAVTALPDAVWGQRMIALVVGEAKPHDLDLWCRKHLPGPWRPKAFISLEGLPRTALGKLRRCGLPSLALAHLADPESPHNGS